MISSTNYRNFFLYSIDEYAIFFGFLSDSDQTYGCGDAGKSFDKINPYIYLEKEA